MKILSVDRPEALDQAFKVLAAGGMVVFPTDTVYGLGVSVFNRSAIDRIYETKDRDQTKAIPILLADINQLPLVAGEMGSAAQKIGLRFWPGALTMVIPKNSTLPSNLSLLPTIGVRIPNHAFARQLIRLAGPLATTSANLSGQPSAVTIAEAVGQLGEKIDLYIDGGRTPGRIASTVIDCTQTPPVILRAGPITEEDIRSALRND